MWCSRKAPKAGEQELIDFCKDRIASYKKPKSIDFIDFSDMPMTGGGYKIFTRELRDRYRNSFIVRKAETLGEPYNKQTPKIKRRYHGKCSKPGGRKKSRLKLSGSDRSDAWVVLSSFSRFSFYQPQSLSSAIAVNYHNDSFARFSHLAYYAWSTFINRRQFSVCAARRRLGAGCFTFYNGY